MEILGSKLPLLQSERLILRNAYEKDLEDLYEVLNLESTLKYNCMDHMTHKDIEILIKSSHERQHDFFLESKETHKLIGAVTLERDSLRYGVRSLCISYYIHQEYMRKGLMSEALRTVLDYLFNELQLECVSARVFAPNLASNALLESLGFTREGTLKHAVKGYLDIVYDDNLYVLFNKKK